MSPNSGQTLLVCFFTGVELLGEFRSFECDDKEEMEQNDSNRYDISHARDIRFS